MALIFAIIYVLGVINGTFFRHAETGDRIM